MTAKKTVDTAPVKPTDHKKSAEELHEATLAEEELLAEMPALRAPHKLRLRHKNRLRILMMEAAVDEDGKLPKGENGEEREKPDTDSLEAVARFMEVAAKVDEFAESIAEDVDAYVAWAEGKDYDVFFALLNRYASAVGE